MAYDALEVPYNTRVVRSENIEGPYYDITGRDCSAGQGDCYPIVTHPYRFSEGSCRETGVIPESATVRW